MGYVRIEPERAGRLGGYIGITFRAIDDVTDARAKYSFERSEIRIVRT